MLTPQYPAVAARIAKAVQTAKQTGTPLSGLQKTGYAALAVLAAAHDYHTPATEAVNVFLDKITGSDK